MFAPSTYILKPFAPVNPVFKFSGTEPIPELEDKAGALKPVFEMVETVGGSQPFVDKLLEHA